MQKFIRTCEWCDSKFETEWSSKIYCTRRHKEAAREFRKSARNRKPRITYSRICKGCASDYTTSRNNQLYCSSHCSKWFKDQVKRERDKDYVNQRTPAFKRRIYFKTDGRCGICHEIIDLALKYPDQRSFSIDHIIPRGLGGTHSFENLQPAHLICNAKRGASPLTVHA